MQPERHGFRKICKNIPKRIAGRRYYYYGMGYILNPFFDASRRTGIFTALKAKENRLRSPLPLALSCEIGQG